MKNQTIIKGNKLIAEFMGYSINPNVVKFDDNKSITEQWNNDRGSFVHVPKGSGVEWYKIFHKNKYYQLFTDFTFCKLSESDIEFGITINGKFISINDIQYDKSWDWLMPVVEKIENFNDGCTLCIIEDERCHINTQTNFEVDSVGYTKIEAVYNAIIEFIKWYNQQQFKK